MSTHHYTRSANVEALSINNHKKNKQSPPNRKHLLALLSSFTREDADIRSEQAEELCCFDRMKKLIARKNQPIEVQQKDQMSSMLIEQKINQLESALTRKVQPSSNATPCVRSSSTTNFQKKSQGVEQLKKGCLKKYVNHQVGKRQKDLDDARRIIEREVDSQVDALIEDKGLHLTKLGENNETLKRQILELHLQIEGLRIKQRQMQDYIEELEQRCNGHRQTKKVINLSEEKFQDRFHQLFGDCTMEEIKFKLDVAIGKCLDGFDKAENRNQIRLQQQRNSHEKQQQRMMKKISQLKQNQNDLLGSLRTLKLNQQLSQIELEELIRAKTDLASLQKLILAEYTEWHSQRGEAEKRMIRTLGGLSENYAYQEMVKYIVDYDKKYSTNQKLNDYLFKVLRGIQKLRRTIYPEQCNQKLDPLAVLDRIQKWVKLRVEVPTLIKKTTSVDPNYLQ